jgi:hypothetical protein
MTFKQRTLNKQFDFLIDFKIKNLVVSGCSFTFNNSEHDLCSWPYYLRDLGNFKQVYDCSLPGAGNYHISQSLQWSLELEKLNPADTLVVIMWSGNDRDDFIFSKSAIKSSYPFSVTYTEKVQAGLSGHNEGGNIDIELARKIRNSKDKNSRSVENFLYVNSTWHYLKSNGYQFCFLNYANRSDINNDFEINNSIPLHLRTEYSKMFLNVETLYNWSVKHDLISEDHFHPCIDGHLKWTQQVLIPGLTNFLKTT